MPVRNMGSDGSLNYSLSNTVVHWGISALKVYKKKKINIVDKQVKLLMKQSSHLQMIVEISAPTFVMYPTVLQHLSLIALQHS